MIIVVCSGEFNRNGTDARIDGGVACALCCRVSGDCGKKVVPVERVQPWAGRCGHRCRSWNVAEQCDLAEVVVGVDLLVATVDFYIELTAVDDVEAISSIARADDSFACSDRDVD